MGPHAIPDHFGCIQFLTRVDDYTTIMTWTHIMKNKTDYEIAFLNKWNIRINKRS